MTKSNAIGYLALPLAGGTMTGNLILNGDPSASLQAATKQYVDTVASGIDIKDASYAASTTNFVATYSNGAAGIGATLTNADTLAAFSVDGVSPPLNSRILIKDQSSTLENGIYTLTTVGSGAVAWVLTRATDYDTPAQITPGTLTVIQYGTVNAVTSWIETATVSSIGTDPIVFVQFTAGVGANRELSNLMAVAINTALLSASDNTLEFGAQNNRWTNMYATNYQTGHTNADAYTLSAWDVNDNISVPFITFTAGNTPTCALAGSVTGVTQAPLTNNTTLATCAYADAAAAAAVTYPITLAQGGTNANLTASNGGIFYSTATAGAILSGTATALQMLQSGANAAPTWSTATWPATTTANQILYSSANNTVAGLATANSAALVTTSAGVPVLSSSMTNGQLIIGSTGATPVAASVTQGTNMTITAGAGTLSFASKGGLLGIQIFTSGTAQTYTPTSGTNNIVIELIGGGAGGGGTAATSGTQAAAGGGGGAGSYLRKLVTGMSGLTGTYTVGTAANGGSAGNNNGTAGNNTTFQINSITYTAQGGSAGGGSAASAGTGSLGTGGAGGLASTGDLNVSGGIGGTGAVINSGGIAVNAAGGVSPLYGTQSTPVTFNVGASTAGSDGGLYGGGGAGAYSQGTQTAKAGGNGRPGLIIVWEYS